MSRAAFLSVRSGLGLLGLVVCLSQTFVIKAVASAGIIVGGPLSACPAVMAGMLFSEGRWLCFSGAGWGIVSHEVPRCAMTESRWYPLAAVRCAGPGLATGSVEGALGAGSCRFLPS